MRFPIEFTKSSGDYDFISPIVNFTGNAAVISAGLFGVGLVSYLALKALGFTSVAVGTATAIPVAGAIIAAGAAVVGLAALTTLAYMLFSALWHR